MPTDRIILVISGGDDISLTRGRLEANAAGGHRLLSAIAPGACVYAATPTAERPLLAERLRDAIDPSVPWCHGATQSPSQSDAAIVIGGSPWERASDVEVCLLRGLHVRAQPPIGCPEVLRILCELASAKDLVLDVSGAELVSHPTVAATVEHARDGGDSPACLFVGCTDNIYTAAIVMLWLQRRQNILDGKGIEFAFPKSGGIAMTTGASHDDDNDPLPLPSFPCIRDGVMVGIGTRGGPKRRRSWITAFVRTTPTVSCLRKATMTFISSIQSMRLTDIVMWRLRQAEERSLAVEAHALTERLRTQHRYPTLELETEKMMGTERTTEITMREALQRVGAWKQAVCVARALRRDDQYHTHEAIASVIVRFAGLMGVPRRHALASKPIIFVSSASTTSGSYSPLSGARPAWGHATYIADTMNDPRNVDAHRLSEQWRMTLMFQQARGWLFGEESRPLMACVDDWALLARARWLLSPMPFSSAPTTPLFTDVDDVTFTDNIIRDIFPNPIVFCT